MLFQLSYTFREISSPAFVNLIPTTKAPQTIWPQEKMTKNSKKKYMFIQNCKTLAKALIQEKEPGASAHESIGCPKKTILCPIKSFSKSVCFVKLYSIQIKRFFGFKEFLIMTDING